MPRTRSIGWAQLKLGLIAIVAIVLSTILILAVGGQGGFPWQRYPLKARFVNVQGMKTGAVVRIGGKDVEGSYVVSGPAMVGAQLVDSHPSKKVAIDFLAGYEKAYGAGTANQFAGHAYDAQIVMQKILPDALKKAKPGTPEFRAALRDGIEYMGRTIFSHGVMLWTPTDRWGYTNETGVLLKVDNVKFVVVQ